jgi:hypothetical protein
MLESGRESRREQGRIGENEREKERERERKRERERDEKAINVIVLTLRWQNGHCSITTFFPFLCST